MRIDGRTINLSASDLVGHLNCRHLTALDIAVAKGALAKPSVWDPVLELLAERGAQHERSYIEHLRASGLQIIVIEGIGMDPSSLAHTRTAMRAGAAIIVQGALQSGRWGGRLDVLKRVELPSALGAWSYVVIDTKLARETKGNTVLQLCLYSDLLTEEQGAAPEFAYVVTPNSGFEPQEFRLADYAAYFRRVRKSLELAVSGDADVAPSYPDPIAHCDVCRWRTRCADRRRADDHPSLVAGITKVQISEFGRRGVTTTAALATLPLPLPWKPDRGAIQSYEKIREQARLQVKGRTLGKVIHETLAGRHISRFRR
jgi:predicted RecB family nuclease